MKNQSIKVNNESIILSKYNVVNDDENLFISSRHGVKFKVDFLKQCSYDVEKIDDGDENDENDEISNEFKDQVSRYIKEQYTNGEFLITGSKLIIKGFKTSLSNYWTGIWISEYDLKDGIGKISIDVHYYEDGNVRLQINETIKLNNNNNDIKDIKEIKNQEDKLQIKLNRYFTDLNEGVFKNLRRQLPVTRSKINWGKSIGNYKLGKAVN